MSFTPSNPAANPLRDILHHIAAYFVKGFDYAAFRDDVRTLYAVTRCLEANGRGRQHL